MIIALVILWLVSGIYSYNKVLRDAEKKNPAIWKHYGKEFFQGEALFAACLGPVGAVLLWSE